MLCSQLLHTPQVQLTFQDLLPDSGIESDGTRRDRGRPVSLAPVADGRGVVLGPRAHVAVIDVSIVRHHRRVNDPPITVLCIS